MSHFQEYLEAARGVAMATHGKDEKFSQRVKDFLNTTIGKLKGWKITVIDKDGKISPMVHSFNAKTLRDLEIGGLAIPPEELENLNAGKIIKPYAISAIDTDQRIVTITKDWRSTMFMPKDLNKGKGK